MTMPKPSEKAKAAFQKLVPSDPSVALRPMFGNLAAFVNGNMFTGLFGEDLFVRVSEEDQAKLRRQGGRPFEPMPGRAMTGYVVVPASWIRNPDGVRTWVTSALSWSRALPAKTEPAATGKGRGTLAAKRGRPAKTGAAVRKPPARPR